MPLITNELIVKITVEEEQNQQEASANQQGEESEESGTDALVEVIIEKVLEILKEREER